MVKMLTKIVSIITNSKSFFLINNYSKQERIMLNVTVPSILEFIYVSLGLRVQNRRKKWNFPLNFRTMCKLSDLYSGIFQNY